MCGQALKAMFGLFKKARALALPNDVQMQLFLSVVLLVALYGCEIWAFEDCSMIEKIAFEVCKYVLRVEPFTTTFMVYGMLGEFPVYVHIKCRVVNY